MDWRLPAIFLVILVIGVGLYLQRPREVQYQGKPMTRWLDELEAKHPAEKRNSANEAVRQMGTNIVPALLDMLRSAPSYSKRQMASSMSQTELAHRRAIAGFQALGSAAVPALSRHLLNPGTAGTAAQALSHLGPDAAPALLHAMTNQNAVIRQKVEMGLEATGPAGEVIVPALIRNLKDADSHVRAYAARGLGRGGLEPEVVVPALIEGLRDPDSEVRAFAAEALGRFGPKANSALPSLVNAAKDKDSHVSRAVFKALAQIEPGPEQKAGVK